MSVAWSWDPAIVIALAVTGTLYAAGTYRLWRASALGHGVRRLEALAFAAGWMTLVAAFVSPLHRFGEMLFAAHMAQHELLMVVAAPLLVLGRPLVPFLWGLPKSWRRAVGGVGRVRWVRHCWRAITDPPVAWLLQMLALWLWHAPRLFDAALRSDAVHAVQHLCFLLSACLFWWALIHGRRGRLGYGAAVLYLFTTAALSTVLGALLAFAPRAWYAAYAATTGHWGLTPLQDQQLAGFIMWIPAGVAYLAASLVMFASWLRESEWRVQERERVGDERLRRLTT